MSDEELPAPSWGHRVVQEWIAECHAEAKWRGGEVVIGYSDLLARRIDAALAERPSITDCIAHRCANHRDVPPLNHNEFSGAECGACLAGVIVDDLAEYQQRADLAEAKLAEREAQIAALHSHLTIHVGDEDGSHEECGGPHCEGGFCPWAKTLDAARAFVERLQAAERERIASYVDGWLPPGVTEAARTKLAAIIRALGPRT